MRRCIRRGGGSPEPYASRHILRFCFGLVLMIAIALVDIRFIARLSWPRYVVGTRAAAAGGCASAMSARARSAGSTFGGMQLQPSELMKIALVLALAAWFHRASWERIGNPLFLLPPTLRCWCRPG